MTLGRDRAEGAGAKAPAIAFAFNEQKDMFTGTEPNSN